MQVDFAVFTFVARVYNSESISFHADERRNIFEILKAKYLLLVI